MFSNGREAIALKKNNWIQILGMASTVLGIVATMLGGYVSDQKMKEEVNIQVQKALAEKESETNENEEES